MPRTKSSPPASRERCAQTPRIITSRSVTQRSRAPRARDVRRPRPNPAHRAIETPSESPRQRPQPRPCVAHTRARATKRPRATCVIIRSHLRTHAQPRPCAARAAPPRPCAPVRKALTHIAHRIIAHAARRASTTSTRRRWCLRDNAWVRAFASHTRIDVPWLHACASRKGGSQRRARPFAGSAWCRMSEHSK